MENTVKLDLTGDKDFTAFMEPLKVACLFSYSVLYGVQYVLYASVFLAWKQKVKSDTQRQRDFCKNLNQSASHNCLRKTGLV